MKQLILVMAVACLALSANGELNWFNSGAISNQNGIVLAANKTNYTIGCFAQMIYAGSDGLADSFIASGTGTSDDDVVVATEFAGQKALVVRAGIFPQLSTNSYRGSITDGQFYVRVYNAPNLDFNLGTSASIPSAATFYWQSALHSYTFDEEQPLPDNWDFAPTGGKTLLPIPEPGVFGLGVIGLISLRLFARKRK
jgi:hypothetical protein